MGSLSFSDALVPSRSAVVPWPGASKHHGRLQGPAVHLKTPGVRWVCSYYKAS